MTDLIADPSQGPMPAPTSRSPPRPIPTTRLSPLAPAPPKVSPVPYASPSSPFAYRRFSASRISDSRGSLDKDEEAGTPGRSETGDLKDRERSLSGLKPFTEARWAPRYGPAWRVGFGNSNERGSGNDEAIDDGSPEGRPVEEAPEPSSRPRSPDMKAESESSNGGLSKMENSILVENRDVKPKRKPRVSAAKKVKGEEGSDDGPPSAKKRKGACFPVVVENKS